MRNRGRLDVIALAFSYVFLTRAEARPTGSADDERPPKRPPPPAPTRAPVPAPAPVKTVRLSKRTADKFKEFTEMVKDMNEAQALASFLLTVAPFQILLGGAGPDGWVEIQQYDWELTQTALAGLSTEYRLQLRYFCRDEQRIQDNSPADRKFWQAMGDQFNTREPKSVPAPAPAPAPTPKPAPKPSPDEGPDRDSHRGPPPKPPKPPKEPPAPKPPKEPPAPKPAREPPAPKPAKEPPAPKPPKLGGLA